MKPFFITCKSGREFIVYTDSRELAEVAFDQMVVKCEYAGIGDVRNVWAEEVATISEHAEEHTIALVDERKTPGA